MILPGGENVERGGAFQIVVSVSARDGLPARAATLADFDALAGLREALAQSVPPVWALQETGQPDLSALANGNPALPATMDCWPLVLDQLKQRFDWVLLPTRHSQLPMWVISWAAAGTCSALTA